MPHIDPDAVALAALGEPLDSASRDHLAGCAACAQEVASLTAAATAAREGSGAGLVAPPAAVWERVRAELGLDAALVPGDAARPPAPLAEARPSPSPAPPSPAPLAPAPPPRADGGRPARPARGRWLAVAAAGLVVGGVAGGLVVAAVQRSAPETVVAEGRLDALPGWSASGDAVVEEGPDGRRTLVVQVSDADADGFREVWLLDESATRLVSLGVLDGDEGRFTIPDGLDLAEFPVVDVSAEAYDGDPAHSGDSIVRGQLTLPA